MSARITLFSRPGCHLCDDARAVVERVSADVGADWEERDITARGEDLAAYREKIPVVLVDGAEVAHWFIDEDLLRAALAPANRA